MRLAIYISRALRTVADLLERRSGGTAYMMAPDGDEESLAALRERYPGAPDHWLRLVARQLPEDGTQTAAAPIDDKRSAAAPRPRTASSRRVKKKRVRSTGTSQADSGCAAIDRAAGAPVAQPLPGVFAGSADKPPPVPSADRGFSHSKERMTEPQPAVFRRPAGSTGGRPAPSVMPRFHAVPATAAMKDRPTSAVTTRVLRNIRATTALMHADRDPYQALNAPEHSPPPAAPAPPPARRPEPAFLPACHEPAVPAQAQFALAGVAAAGSPPTLKFPCNPERRTEPQRVTEWAAPAEPLRTESFSLTRTVSDPQWPELPTAANAERPVQATATPANDEVTDRWNALPF